MMLADTRPALIGQMLVQIATTNAKVFDEVIIFDINLSDQDKKVMQQIMPCRFIKYKSPISNELLKHDRFKRFSLIMFARYEMFRFIREYSLIMWMDTDIVIQGDLQALIDETEGYEFSILCEDPKNKSAKKVDYMRTNFFHPMEDYDMNRYLYCTGMIILRDCMQQCCDYTEWCYKKTVEWAENLNLPDQGVINALIQEFHLNVKAIGDNGKYGCYPFIGRNCEKATTVHSWGANKFWNNWYLHCEFPVWEDCYQKWLAKGGSALKRQHIPEVSVVIPTYKPDLGYFKQCIDSLLAQELNGFEPYSNYEVIIVAEPFNIDEIKEFIANYNDSRLSVYFNEKRLGIAASLNRGMRLAKGTYIARIDDDDIAAPTRFEQQTAYLNTHPDVDLCTSDYLYFGDMNDGRIAMEGEMAKAWSMLTCPFDHPTLMFKRDFFVENNLFYDEHRGYVEDWELWQRAFRIGMRVGCIHDILLYHRWHNGSAGQTNKTIEMMREMICVNFKELGIDVALVDLPLLSPWNGKVKSQTEYECIENYFRKAIDANERKKLYDPLCLARAFSMRLSEARCGTIQELIIPRDGGENGKSDNILLGNTRYSKIKTLLKKIFKPFYQPIRRRFQDPLFDAQNNVLEVKRLIGETNNRIVNLSDDAQKVKTQVVAELSGISALIIQIQDELFKLRQETEQISLEMKNRFDVIESKIYEQTENARQQIEAKIFEQTENTRQKLGAKIYEQAENTRQEISARLYEIEKKSELIENLQLQQQRNRKKVFLIGTPEHSNIGDAAITVGEIEFLHRYYPAHEVVELPAYDMDKWYDKFTLMIQKDDIIFLQGGGNLGDYYVYEENIRRRVVQDFPMNQIVILPQTICFSDTERGKQELKISEEIYNAHNNLKLLTRGKQSLTFAQNHFKNVRCVNALDMALTIQFITNQTRDGILLCLRDLDDESGFQAEEYQSIIAAIKHADEHYEKTANIYRDNRESKIDMSIRKRVVYEELRKFAAREVIVTDRLHGLIFSIITKTPCVLLSSFNQKIPEFYEFFKDSNAIIYIDKDIHKLNDAINQAKRVKNAIYPVLTEDVFGNIHDFIEE